MTPYQQLALYAPDKIQDTIYFADDDELNRYLASQHRR